MMKIIFVMWNVSKKTKIHGIKKPNNIPEIASQFNLLTCQSAAFVLLQAKAFLLSSFGSISERIRVWFMGQSNSVDQQDSNQRVYVHLVWAAA